MSEVCSKLDPPEPDLKAAGTLPKDDVVQQKLAHAATKPEHKPKLPESEIPPKKRKTRRGKSKRKHPYIKNGRKSTKVIKPEAPHNSNQFLLEDHGVIEDLDENLKCADQVSTSTVTRTRDSSFSVDSEGEFYSSPDDEEQFLIKDFDDQYQSLQVERLASMTKDDLIEEYLLLENKVEVLTNRLRKKEKEPDESEDEDNKPVLQSEIEKLTIENERLRRENDLLRSKSSVTCSSDSEDSETDSSDSCSSSSTSSSSLSRSTSPVPAIDYSQTNGHSSSPASVDPI